MTSEEQQPEQQSPTQDEVDAGMTEGGRLAAIDRKLIHLDRVTGETLVQVRINNSQTLSLIVMTILLAGMVYVISTQIRGLDATA